MWKTVRTKKDGSPLWDVNEQGVVYSYWKKQLIGKKSRSNNYYYCVSDIDGSTIYVHQLVAKAFPEICGEWFEGCEVHHKDGNGLNNCATNLIVCTREQHLEYHKQLKEEQENKRFRAYLKRKNREKRKDNQLIIEAVEEANRKGIIIIHYYCRKSKQDKNKLSPIEVSISTKGNKDRIIYQTNFKMNAEDFKKGIYAEEFKKFMDKINSIIL